ncbi:hypothetical protein HGA34_04255 [Candidatus Falkowbacteria bacterium]|nr:hypothetical protein [Candidatus Falkowbacteria bacterium]
MICPQCQHQFNYFKLNLNKERNGKNGFPCPQCGTKIKLSSGFAQQLKIALAGFTVLILSLQYILGRLVKSDAVEAAVYPLIFAAFVYVFYRLSKVSTAEIAGIDPAQNVPPQPSPGTPGEIQADGFKVKLSQDKITVPAIGTPKAANSLVITLILIFVVLSGLLKNKELANTLKASSSLKAVLLAIVAAWLAISAYAVRRWSKQAFVGINFAFSVIFAVTIVSGFLNLQNRQFIDDFESQMRAQESPEELIRNMGTQSRKISNSSMPEHNHEKLMRDKDRDGLLDSEESLKYKTSSTSTDTDNDALSDYEEVSIYKSNPLLADTDGSGVTDGAEAALGDDPAGEGVFNPFTSPEIALYYMEHAIASGKLEAYESIFYYPQSFIDDFIKPNFQTDLEGFKRRFKNKVFSGMTKDNVGAIVIYKQQDVDEGGVAIEYYRFSNENGYREPGGRDKTYFKKVDGRWMADIEREFKELKETNPEGWQLNARVYSTD